MNHSLSLAAINCNRKNVHGYKMTENKDIVSEHSRGTELYSRMEKKYGLKCKITCEIHRVTEGKGMNYCQLLNTTGQNSKVC
jgi:hypothetical protein